MSNSYLVPSGYGKAELTEKHSRFIGQVWRVETEHEARIHIEEVAKQYPDIKYHSTCYILRDENILRYNDGGEPQGAAGHPMLNVFVKEKITNVVCVVTRYYGGIPLGGGGLRRAYGSIAKLALDAAGISRMSMWATLTVPCPYSLYEQMRLLIEKGGGIIENTGFGAEVLLTVLIASKDVESLQKAVTDFSAGTIEITVVGEQFRPGPP